MEKEHSEGFGSLFLLFLAILAITCCLELGSTEDKTAATPEEHGELVHTSALPATAATPLAKTAAKQRLIL